MSFVWRSLFIVDGRAFCHIFGRRNYVIFVMKSSWSLVFSGCTIVCVSWRISRSLSLHILVSIERIRFYFSECFIYTFMPVPSTHYSSTAIRYNCTPNGFRIVFAINVTLTCQHVIRRSQAYTHKLCIDWFTFDRLCTYITFARSSAATSCRLCEFVAKKQRESFFVCAVYRFVGLSFTVRVCASLAHLSFSMCVSPHISKRLALP